MNTERILLAVRGVFLLGLLGFFTYQLATILNSERKRNAFTSNVEIEEIGLDPGVRILLTDRSTEKDYHRRLEILILQSCILFCPDDPSLKIQLDPQETITIQTSLDGLSIDCKQKDETWAVSQINIQPTFTSFQGKADHSIQRSNATAFEAKDSKAVFALNRTRYRGNISIIRKGSQKIYAINSLPIESYLEGVVPSEMPSQYPAEALFAQSIASRSYAYANILMAQNKDSAKDFDVFDTIESQEYLGTTKETSNTTFAVHKTAGRILTYNNRVFPSYFSASSGGQSSAVGMAFPEAKTSDGRNTLDRVMVAKPDPYCLEGIQALKQEDRYWKHTIQLEPQIIKDSIRHWLDAHNDRRNIGWVQDMTVSNNLPGRVEKITVHTSERGVNFEFTGQQFRTDIIGPHIIRSTLWEKGSPKWNEKNKTYDITSYGRGHGVGMSQVSAYAMAKLHNMTAQQILSFFYENAQLTQRWKTLHD